MKRKPPESDTLRNDPRSALENTFVDEHQVRAFAESLVDGTGDDGAGDESSEPPSAKAHSSSSATRPSPVQSDDGQHRDSERVEADSLWRLMQRRSSLPQTLPSLTEDQRAAESAKCLPEDTILAFVEGRLSRAELVRAHRHLDSCEACQILVAEAAHAISGDDIERSSDHEPMAVNLVSGTVLGERYRIQRFVARGGMGEVYEAYDRVLQERIALKTVTATVCDNPKAVRRLMAEVQLARRVSHPNVCRIYDLGSHSEAGVVHFLTMEYVQGESLARRLAREGYLPLDEAVHVARHLLQGLHAAHEAGILHRDFKTDNVMLSPGTSGLPRAVIMDFGLARALDADPGRLTTGANQPLVGTLSYMAPEQVEGATLSVRTDIYAFGIVLYEMLTGHLPFSADSPAATALRRLKDRPKKPSHHMPGLPPELDEIVLKCLSRDPARRYAGTSEVLRALEDVGGSEKPASRRQWSGRKQLGIALAVACATVMAWLWFEAPGDVDAALTAPARPEADDRDSAPARLQAATARQEPAPSSTPDVEAPNLHQTRLPEPAAIRPTPAPVPDRSRAVNAKRLSAARSVRAQPTPSAAPPVPPSFDTGATEAPARSSDDALIVPDIFQQPRRTPSAASSTSEPPSSVPRSPPSPSDTGG